METATRLFTNAHVLTMDECNSVVSAIASQGDRILAVGDLEDLRNYISDDTEIIDVGGKTIIPGFYDAHGHFLYYAEAMLKIQLYSPPIGDCETISDVLAKIKKCADSTPAGEWIVGCGYDDTLLKEKRFLTRHDLDSVSKDHPIFVYHISGHFAMLNSLALQKSGIDASTQNPVGGVIRREEGSNEPDGVLEETAVEKASSKLPELSVEQKIDCLKAMSEYYASIGGTTATEALLLNADNLKILQQAADEGNLQVRVIYNPYHTVYDALESHLFETPMLTRGGVKIVHDGSIQGFTAKLSKPYHTPFKGDSMWCGYSFQSPEAIIDIVKKYHSRGIQCVIHTNGDGATDDVLKAIELALEETPSEDSRFLLIHAQTVRDDQMDAMRKLQMTPSFFPVHIYYWGDRHYSIFLGPERANHMNPMGTAIKKGLVCSGHCDAPVVPYTPFLSIQTCVTRLTSSGRCLGEDNRVSVLEALRAHTINPAYQNFEDDCKGSIEAGKYADFIVLDTNPLDCDPLKLKDINVLTTVVGGKTIYER